MRYIFVDYETYYSKDFTLKKLDPASYILDQRFEVIGAAVKEGLNGEPKWLNGHTEVMTYLSSLDASDTVLVYHNALFDALITSARFNFKPRATFDTLGIARATLGHVLKSLSLNSVATYLGLGVKGDTVAKVEGMTHKMITDAGLMPAYSEYSKNDVELCAQIFKKLVVEGKFPASELAVMDMVIRCCTDPKLYLNANVLHEHLAIVQARKQELIGRIGVSKEELMSNDKFAQALQMLGVVPPTKTSLATGKVTYAFARTDPEFMALEEHDDPQVQALHAARLGFKSTLEETRTEKFIGLSRLQWPYRSGAPMPVPLRYSGAHTHRLSGDWGLNMQNMPRGGALRRALMAPPGHVVLAVDSSQIEARIVAWICGQRDLVQQFANGEDVYSTFASKVFGRPIDKKKDKVERFIGKTCLAEGTLVLTDTGWLPIQYITTSHRLWDGMEWVEHQGLIPQGVRETVSYRGLTATEDHEILTERGWVEWREVHTNPSLFQSALNLGSSPSSTTSATNVPVGDRPDGSQSFVVRAGGKDGLIAETSKQGAPHAAIVARKLPQAQSGIGVTRTHCLTTNTARDSSIGWPQRLLGVIPHLVVCSNTTAGEGYVFIRDGETTALRFFATPKHFLGGIIQSLKWIVSTLMEGMNRGISGLSVALTTSKTNDKLRVCSGASQSLKRKLPTYDLANAGPRSRFTVWTYDGPVVVHNCILGMGYGVGWAKFQRTIKLQSKAQTGQVVELSDEQAKGIVGTYRNTYSAIPETWRKLNDAIPILAAGGGSFSIGPCNFHKGHITLPSGLTLRYHDLKYTDEGWAYTYGGKPKRLYGGALLENIVQSLARIVVMDAALRLQQRFATFGIELALQVHDELVFVVPDDLVNVCTQIALEEINRRPDWASTLPLAAEAEHGPSYGDAK